MIEPFVSTRQVNKEKRRRRILDAARDILVAKGYEALNSRDLAKAAGVTTPTLYKLVGTKTEVLITLSREPVDELVARLNQIETGNALQFVEGIVLESRKMLEEDSSLFRSSMIAMYQLSTTIDGYDAERSYRRRCVEVGVYGCKLAQDQGLLLGNISAVDLGKQLFAAHAAPYREWVYGHLSLDIYAVRALRGFYMCLCSDATPKFLKQLREKIGALPAELDDLKPTQKLAKGKNHGT